MNIDFTKTTWSDFEYWIENDQILVIKIKELLKDIRSTPFTGIGKPEPLRHDLKGYWSRRITHEHRLVCKISGNKGDVQQCLILRCRFHY